MIKGYTSDNSERSLYECFHARVNGKRIYCAKGHPLQGKGERNGSLNIERLARGELLIISVCQDCADFESVGDPLPDKERGCTKNNKKQTSNSREVICQKSLAR